MSEKSNVYQVLEITSNIPEDLLDGIYLQAHELALENLKLANEIARLKNDLGR